jgi:hypothetical protein
MQILFSVFFIDYFNASQMFSKLFSNGFGQHSASILVAFTGTNYNDALFKINIFYSELQAFLQSHAAPVNKNRLTPDITETIFSTSCTVKTTGNLRFRFALTALISPSMSLSNTMALSTWFWVEADTFLSTAR